MRNALIYRHLKTHQNSHIFVPMVTDAQEDPSHEGICKDYSRLLVE